MAASAPVEDGLGFGASTSQSQSQLSFHSIQPAPVPPPPPLVPPPPLGPPPQLYEPIVRGTLTNLNIDLARRQPYVRPELQASTSWVPPPPPSWPPPPDTPVYPVKHRPQFPQATSAHTYVRSPPPRYPSVVAMHPNAPPTVARRRPLWFKILAVLVTLAIIVVAVIIIWEMVK